MAHPLELDHRQLSIPHPDLRRRTVVKNLIRQGRIPILAISEGETPIQTVTCFIPPGKNTPPETFELSIKEAAKIAKVRDELQRPH